MMDRRRTDSSGMERYDRRRQQRRVPTPPGVPRFDNTLSRFVSWFRVLEIIGFHFIVLGVVLMLTRFPTDTYRIVLTIASQRIWAVAFLLAGLVMLLSRSNTQLLTPISYALMFALCSVFSLGTALAGAMTDAVTPLTPVLWGLLASISIYGAVMAEGEYQPIDREESP
jgi:hypothetical protein